MRVTLVTYVTIVTNIKVCVIGHQMCHRALLVTDFNKVRGEGWGAWGSKAFGDYFVVSRRQKVDY
jgi:hypothetical protein